MKQGTKPISVLFYAFFFSILLVIGILFLNLFFLFGTDSRKNEREKPVFSANASYPTVILDAGHGGEDPGAISVFGKEEKHFNLDLVKRIGAFLEAEGIRVIYTRTEDILLSDPKAATKKSGDLMARVAIGRQHPEAIFVSIHMNTLSIEKYCGLQTFYSEECSLNRPLAQQIQNDVIAMLQPNNHREAKNSNGSIYILDRISGPSVLIECGFLSNRNEASLLENEEYRGKLAYVLSRSLLPFLLQKA